MIFMISNFPNNAFETAKFWCIVGLAATFHLLQRNKLFSVICSFYCYLVKEGSAMKVA